MMSCRAFQSGTAGIVRQTLLVIPDSRHIAFAVRARFARLDMAALLMADC